VDRCLVIDGVKLRIRCTASEYAALGALGSPGEWSPGARAALRRYLGAEPTQQALTVALGEPLTTRIRAVLLAVVDYQAWRPDAARVARAKRGR
jgi:hypothetical protein